MQTHTHTDTHTGAEEERGRAVATNIFASKQKVTNKTKQTVK